MCGEGCDPAKGERTKRYQNQDRGPGEPLILYVFRWVGPRLGQTLVILEYPTALPVKGKSSQIPIQHYDSRGNVVENVEHRCLANIWSSLDVSPSDIQVPI